MVEKAELKGYLDQEIADYLLSPKISLDLKAAIINALSFEILGTDNAERFIRFLNIKYHSEDFVESAWVIYMLWTTIFSLKLLYPISTKHKSRIPIIIRLICYRLLP
jgi:hypothetical protein